MKPDHLSDEEEHNLHHKFIETLIKREEQRIQFRQSVIEKTVSSLVWSSLVVTLTYAFTVFKDHWK